MNIRNEIRDMQFELISIVNSTFDKIIGLLDELEINNQEPTRINEFQIKYPLTYAAGFKGTKPISVLINNNEKETPTWKSVTETILKEVIKDEEMKVKLMDLREIVLGRKRKRISEKKDSMRSPIEITENLYVETHYDTEALIKFIIEILNTIEYDYSKIEIKIRK